MAPASTLSEKASVARRRFFFERLRSDRGSVPTEEKSVIRCESRAYRTFPSLLGDKMERAHFAVYRHRLWKREPNPPLSLSFSRPSRNCQPNANMLDDAARMGELSSFDRRQFEVCGRTPETQSQTYSRCQLPASVMYARPLRRARRR